MEPATGVFLLSLAFGGTHIGLASRPVRTVLVTRLGRSGFDLLFWLVAAISFSALIRYYAMHRFEGAAGLALGDAAAVRAFLIAAIVCGVVLAVAGVAVYSRSPMAPFAPDECTPRGLERITRHPFFAGMVLFGGAHALLATRLIGTVGFAGFALLAIFGGLHQDRKLLHRRGPSYAEYLEATSFVPLVAVLAGRQRIAWRELPVGALVTGLATAVALRVVHADILAHDGIWVIGATVGGALLLALDAWRRTRRTPAPLGRPA